MTKEINPTTIGDVYGLNQAAEPTVNKIDQVSKAGSSVSKPVLQSNMEQL